MSKTPKTVNFCSIPSKLSIIQTWISRNWYFWNCSRGKLYTWNLLLAPHQDEEKFYTVLDEARTTCFQTLCIWQRCAFCWVLSVFDRNDMTQKGRDDHDISWSMMGICRLLTNPEQPSMINSYFRLLVTH
jgi:hypothetical protein